MKLKLLYLFLFSLSTSLALRAQVSLTATSATLVGSYTTLSSAFTAINNGTHKGVITITLTGNTTETATANLDSSGNPGGSSYSSISIRPQAATAVTILGALAGPLVTLNGADGVVINGLNTGGSSLIISNTDAGTSSVTIRFINDASNNKISNTSIRGAGTSGTLGVVHFSTGLLTGNDGNSFSTCNIDGTSSAASCLFSLGTTTTPDLQNSNDTLLNCNFFDFFNTTIASPVGVNLNGGNTNWHISGNSFYQTTNRTTAVQGLPTSLQIFPSYTNDVHTVIGNFSGGTGPSAIGLLTYTGSGTNILGYIGFSIQAGGGTIVQNNICQNVTVNYAASAGSFSNAGFFGFIGGYDGALTFTSNSVKNFTIFNSSGSALGSAMQFNGRVTTAATTVKPVFTITNNIIDNVIFNAGGTGSTQFYGLRLEASSAGSFTGATTISNPNFIVSGNTITNLSSTIGGASGWIRGIGSVNSNGTGSTCPLWPKATIQNNIINAISCFSSLALANVNTSVGIQFGGSSNATNTTDTIFIRTNTINNINSTNTADLSSSVAGILGTNGIYLISLNRIYGLNNSSPGTATFPFVTGINIRASNGNTGATSNIVNNFVSLGIGNTNNISHFGILNNFSAANGINAYYNSVFIGGTATSGSNNSAALYRGSELFTGVSAITTTMDLKNNILVNQRTGGSGSNYAIAAYTVGTWTSNYNNLNVSNTANTAYYGATAYTLAGYQTAASAEANSKAVAVNFTNTSTADLHLTGSSNGDVNLRGNPVVGITVDYDGQTRSSTSPYMGADEAPNFLPVQVISFNAQLRGSSAILNWNTTAEVNLSHYQIERSTSNNNWALVGSIFAKGATNNNYQFTDANLSTGKYLYRLKIIDKDGSFSYSNIIVLEVSSKNQFVLNQNYPNPVKGNTQLSYQISTDGKVRIELFTQDGRKVAIIVNQQQNSGSYSLSLDCKKYGLAAGNYNYRMVVVDKNNQELFNATRTMIVLQ